MKGVRKMSQGIYKITNKINNKCYIGKSINIESRWKYHIENKNSIKEYNKPLYRAFRKYGIENFSFEIIEELKDYSISNEREKYWIQYYNCYGNNGYNMTSGGDGGQGELFRKPVMQYSLLGEFIKEYESASEAARQLDVFKSNLTAACRGETSQCGGFQWKYKNDPREIKPIAKANGKLVAQYDKNNTFIKIYTSAKEASDITGIGVGSIRHCCNGRSKSAGGYIFKYLE